MLFLAATSFGSLNTYFQDFNDSESTEFVECEIEVEEEENSAEEYILTIVSVLVYKNQRVSDKTSEPYFANHYQSNCTNEPFRPPERV